MFITDVRRIIEAIATLAPSSGSLTSTPISVAQNAAPVEIWAAATGAKEAVLVNTSTDNMYCGFLASGTALTLVNYQFPLAPNERVVFGPGSAGGRLVAFWAQAGSGVARGYRNT